MYRILYIPPSLQDQLFSSLTLRLKLGFGCVGVYKLYLLTYLLTYLLERTIQISNSTGLIALNYLVCYFLTNWISTPLFIQNCGLLLLLLHRDLKLCYSMVSAK